MIDRFCEKVATVFSTACRIANKLKTGKIPWAEANRIKQRLIKFLDRICRQPLKFKPGENLRKFLVGPNQAALFTFLNNPAVPPTNNHAEQSLRYLVIFRKTSFGTRSESGMNAHGVLTSLVQTARRQGVHPRSFLETLLTSDTPTAISLLYNNSG